MNKKFPGSHGPWDYCVCPNVFIESPLGPPLLIAGSHGLWEYCGWPKIFRVPSLSPGELMEDQLCLTISGPASGSELDEEDSLGIVALEENQGGWCRWQDK